MNTTIVPRRSFLERLGLGAGALILSPIAQALVSEARGQTAVRKRAIFLVHGNGLSPRGNFSPAELADSDKAVLNGPTSYTWPSMLRTLERWRPRMLLVDGLANTPASGNRQHGTGYSALACFPAANGTSNEAGGAPGNITIDQFIANKIGASSRVKSVLYGVSTSPAGMYARAFASGPEKPEPHFQSPSLMFNDLFGTLATDAAGLNRGAYRQRVLLDGMRADLKRLESALAGAERRKLEHYVSAIEQIENRLKIALPACRTAPFMQPGNTVEDRLEAMTDIATLALVCGLTNVAGISIGVGDSHTQFPRYTRLHVGTQFEGDGGIHSHGHSPIEVLGAAWDVLHNFHGTLINKMATALEGIKEGDRTAFDNSVFVYFSDNGSEHHSRQHRHPLYILGNAGGALKTGGRFLRYAPRGTAGGRSMADLFCTIATAVGVPTNTFGKGGNEPVTGPLPEILT